MEIIKDGEYLEFEVNEGWKSNSFKIKIPPKDECQADNRKLIFKFSKSSKISLLENLTTTQSMLIILEFLEYYNDYPTEYSNGEYKITLSEEDGFYLTVDREKEVRKLGIYNL